METFNFGENLRCIRVQKGISQDAISSKLGINQTKYSRMERSECVPAKPYVDLAAEYLEVSAAELLPPGWDYGQYPTKLQKSMTRVGLLTYRLLLFVAFYDMAMGFCDGADIRSQVSRAVIIIFFEILAIIFIFYTEKPLSARIRNFLRKN
ncbi:MAG: helix-turn-helix transcriptional regulator [Bacteroidota bacterium]